MTGARARLEWFAVLLALALAPTGCGRQAGPPPIAVGATCVGCGMDVENLRFACELRTRGAWRVYDSIECLLADARADRDARAWLADYDSRTLHAADSLWIVKGSFPSPMGGGYAAFLDRGAAEAVAARTSGHVDRATAFSAEQARP